jgi:hypothetical protein
MMKESWEWPKRTKEVEKKSNQMHADAVFRLSFVFCGQSALKNALAGTGGAAHK